MLEEVVERVHDARLVQTLDRALAERALDPVIGKSLVLYARKSE